MKASASTEVASLATPLTASEDVSDKLNNSQLPSPATPTSSSPTANVLVHVQADSMETRTPDFASPARQAASVASAKASVLSAARATRRRTECARPLPHAPPTSISTAAPAWHPAQEAPSHSERSASELVLPTATTRAIFATPPAPPA